MKFVKISEHAQKSLNFDVQIIMFHPYLRGDF